MSATDRIPSSEITPESVYLNRRTFMNTGLAAASLLTTGGFVTKPWQLAVVGLVHKPKVFDLDDLI